MADKLLIRAYDVEVGDCIYCRIPKGRKVGGTIDDFHILIDCGSVGGVEHLEAAMAHLAGQLPSAGGGKKRLDLLVATHEHKDHILGYGLPAFENLKIGQIWMNAAMDPDHPQASGANALHALATTAMRRLAGLNLALAPEVQDQVALYGLENDDAMLALRDTLPQRNGITPRYVHAGVTGASAGLPLNAATIRVLGPEKDIDHFYLGEDIDGTLNGFGATSGRLSTKAGPLPDVLPANVSAADFRRLQSRMLSNSLAFADLSSQVTNNTSVVLLIEWKGKRLLFVGDAEWDREFKSGKANGAWNVMWNKRKPDLDQPIHFLKIGHHGSENATPWDDGSDDGATEPAAILDAILPVPSTGTPKAKAVVSTLRKNYKTIPRSALLKELGRRVGNRRNYKTAFTTAGVATSGLAKFTEFEKPWFSARQPWRTDCERILKGVAFVDVEISP